MICPICSRPLDIEPHRRGERWTGAEIAQMQQWRRWLKIKVIARLFGVSEATIARVLHEEAWRLVPRVTVEVRRYVD